MNPQIPIALRMSGHLLLGIVRIYSKKVEYLQHDYNVLRIDISKAYQYADINLPEDANQARFESITLPDNFALDLMDIDSYNPNEYDHFTSLIFFIFYFFNSESNLYHFNSLEHRLIYEFLCIGLPTAILGLTKIFHFQVSCFKLIIVSFICILEFLISNV